MIKIGIILGSTRPHRRGDQVAQWAYDLATRRSDAKFELVDLRDHPLPHLEEPPLMRPATGSEQPPVRAWANLVASLDGFVLVTPEYNYSTSGVLKNALDHLYTEWNNKAVGFISYGSAGGARAVQHLRATCSALQMADVAAQVTLSTQTDFENHADFKPRDPHATALDATLNQVIAWSTALAPLRGQSQANAA